jgi:hypothetical protein
MYQLGNNANFRTAQICRETRIFLGNVAEVE